MCRRSQRSSETIRQVSEAALTIYRRSEGYYLVVSAQTTTGLWRHVAEPPVLLREACEPADLGSEALDRLAEPRPITPHPGRDEWTEARRRSLGPILSSAKVRSWKAFITTATLVDVGRTDDTFKVTPMNAMPKPQGAFEPDIHRVQMLQAPSAESLGRAIVQAFAAGADS